MSKTTMLLGGMMLSLSLFAPRPGAAQSLTARDRQQIATATFVTLQRMGVQMQQLQRIHQNELSAGHSAHADAARQQIRQLAGRMNRAVALLQALGTPPDLQGGTQRSVAPSFGTSIGSTGSYGSGPRRNCLAAENQRRVLSSVAEESKRRSSATTSPSMAMMASMQASQAAQQLASIALSGC